MLVADPARDEARLHLACTALSLDRAAEARKTLEGLLDRRPSRDVAYLAHLFLGRVHESEGRLDSAKEQYDMALGLDPAAQSAAMALSHALVKRGEPDEARTVLESALHKAGARPTPDPFWAYSVGPSGLHVAMFERLREEAGR